MDDEKAIVIKMNQQIEAAPKGWQKNVENEFR